MALGRELAEHLQMHPDKAREVTTRLRREIRQIKAGTRDKSSEGTATKLYPPKQKDKTMEQATVSFKDHNGKDAVLTTEQFEERFGLKIDGQVTEEDDLSQADERVVRREIAIRDRKLYSLGSNAKRIGIKVVEYMAMAAVIVLAFVGGVLLLKGILWEKLPAPALP